MNTRTIALVLSKLMLACFASVPAIAVAQVPTDRFAWVKVVCGTGCYIDPFVWPIAVGIAVWASGNETLITNNAADREPSWSPDGTRIAFQRDGEIMVIPSAGGSPVNVTNHPAYDAFPAWSPDGTRIAFASDRDGQLELYLMNVDGSGVVRLTNGLTNGIGFGGRPAWAPNGAKIVFDCYVPGYGVICSINTDGTGIARLTPDPGWDFGAAWSPDGSRIAFTTDRFTGYYAIAMMKPDGTGISQVPVWEWGSTPSWSPEGYRIVYSSSPYYVLPPDSGETYDIYRMNADGTRLTRIAMGFNAVWGPALPAPPGPAVALLPPDLLFGVQTVGTTSSQRTFGLFNYGSAGLAISGIVTIGDFAQTNNCNNTVAPGAVCPISVVFAPTALGTRSGTLTITDNAPGSPHLVTLSGVGNSPPVASFTYSCIALTCYFDGSASADSDGWIARHVWRFGDGTESQGSAVSYTYATGGTYTVTLTVTDNDGGTGARSSSVTVPSGSMHVADLDGTSRYQQSTWIATVTVTIHDSGHAQLANAIVNGSWSNGGTSSCTTNVSGQCFLSKSIPRQTRSATFTVSNVTHALLPYKSADNHDPDGDSNGTSITVTRP